MGFWEQVHEHLRRRIRPADLQSWFGDVQVVGVTPTDVVIELPNGFAVRWVERHFLSELHAAVVEAAGTDLQVRLQARSVATDTDDAGDFTAPPQAEAATAAAPPPAPTHADTPTNTQVAASSGSFDDGGITEAELLAELDVDPVAAGSGSADGPRVVADRDAPAAPTATFGLPLNDGYRFDTFVIGEANQLAHAAALSVAEAPGQSYNPLYIYGQTGLGKTHLLHAIGHYAMATQPGIRVAYITTEQFISRFIQALSSQNRNTARREFKDFFRSIDVLLVDDVQFLSQKGASLQEEFFHTFNALIEGGRQVVLTSDTEPADIPKLEDRLRSRFAWGLITDIARPDRETRIAILHKKARAEGAPVDDAVLSLIGERVTTNVRELEGALTRVLAAASLRGRAITLELAAEVLDSYASRGLTPGRDLTIEDIQRAVCERFGLSHEELVGRSRTRQIARPRQIAMYLSRTLLGAPSTQIGQRFGGKDHSTVLHAHDRIEELMQADQEVFDLIEELTSRLRIAPVSETAPAPRQTVGEHA